VGGGERKKKKRKEENTWGTHFRPQALIIANETQIIIAFVVKSLEDSGTGKRENPRLSSKKEMNKRNSHRRRQGPLEPWDAEKSKN